MRTALVCGEPSGGHERGLGVAAYLAAALLELIALAGDDRAALAAAATAWALVHLSWLLEQ